MSEDGVQRSAILLMSLGEEEAVEVFKHLGPREVQKLGSAMAKLTNVTRAQVASVLREFHQEAVQQTTIGSEADQYLRSVLTRALGNGYGVYSPRRQQTHYSGRDHGDIEQDVRGAFRSANLADR